MKEPHDKIVEAQVMAKDAVAQVSAMMNQDNLDPRELEKLKDRLEELSKVLNGIDAETK